MNATMQLIAHAPDARAYTKARIAAARIAAAFTRQCYIANKWRVC